MAGRQQQMAGCENEEGKTTIDSQENCVLVLLFLFHDALALALALALSLFHSLLDSLFHVLWVHVFQHPVELPVQADAELLHEHDPKFVKVLVWRGDNISSSCCSSNAGSLHKWLRWGWRSGN